LITPEGHETWNRQAKTKVAETLAWRIAAFFSQDNVTSATLSKTKSKNKGTTRG
jgi:hypothetical protein